MLLEEQLALETIMARPPMSPGQRLLLPPDSHLRPGVLSSTQPGSGGHTIAELQRSMEK